MMMTEPTEPTIPTNPTEDCSSTEILPVILNNRSQTTINTTPQADRYYQPTTPTTTTTHTKSTTTTNKAKRGRSTSPAPTSTIVIPSYSDLGQSQGQAQSQSDLILQGLWNELQRLLGEQTALLKAPTPGGCSDLASAHAALSQRIGALYDDVTSLWTSTVLQPQDLSKARETMQELSVIERQLGVLHSELEAVAADPTPEGVQSLRPVLALAIQRQPFPQVFRKGEQLSEPDYVAVRLIPSCLAITSVSVMSQVRAQAVCDPASAAPAAGAAGSPGSGHNSPLAATPPGATATIFTPSCCAGSGTNGGSGSGSSSAAARAIAAHELIQPATAALDPGSLTAKFPLHFLDGTKNTPVALRFSVQTMVNGAVPVVVESELSAPFIVMTHKDQWKGAAGLMFKRDSFFYSNAEVPWALVANVLQTQFLRATKQAPPADIRRPLSDFDLAYLSKRFFGSRDVVDQAQFDTFWEWFGTTMDTLRHQRPVLALWWQGLVYGFASKEDVDIALRNEAPGTFIIRFSETFPGSFAIAYATGEGVKHYHVTPQDHALHKTLPDFIIYHAQFTNVLQLKSSRDPVSGENVLQLVRVDKVAAFESFCSKKVVQPRPVVPGYSLLL